MPKMGGFEAFGQLMRIKPDVKVVLCSGNTDDIVLARFPGSVSDGVLHKTYNMEDLEARLERCR